MGDNLPEPTTKVPAENRIYNKAQIQFEDLDDRVLSKHAQSLHRWRAFVQTLPQRRRFGKNTPPKPKKVTDLLKGGGEMFIFLDNKRHEEMKTWNGQHQNETWDKKKRSLANEILEPQKRDYREFKKKNGVV